MTDSMQQMALDTLGAYFGYTSFRSGQDRMVDAILAGRDALGVMPTGAGKSICYQVPALMLPGITFVVSPLLSLMEDQTRALLAAGARPSYLNSSLTPAQQNTVLKRAREGRYQLMYVAPERLLEPRFLAFAQEAAADGGIGVPLVAIDEAHCVSQWGQDFRPAYLQIREFIDSLPQRPIVAAFTATATERVRADIQQMLGLQNPATVVTGFDRKNLYFGCEEMGDKAKAAWVRDYVIAHSSESGIVYCSTRKTVDALAGELAEALGPSGIRVGRYHAGMDNDARRQSQRAFIDDDIQVMVATNAFGMGIDKSNVSFVIHYNMPKSLEAYYQEAGRAGRDGEAAECILLYGPGDVATAQFFLQQAGENEDLSPEERAEVQARDARRLEAMVNYCKTTHCLRGHLLDYFGQAHDPTCGNCGNCRSQFVQVDITRQAQMILSCVKRVQGKLGYYVGADLLSKVLRGSRSQRVLTLGLDGLTTYGLLRDTSEALTRRYLEALEEAGYLVTEPVHKTLRPTPQAGEVLFRGSKVFLTQRAAPAVFRPREEGLERSGQQPEDQELMAALKATRLQLARQEEVPLYVIFSNATLADMARRRPQTMEEFLSVSGVGEVKARKYGAAFLAVLARAEKEEV